MSHKRYKDHMEAKHHADCEKNKQECGEQQLERERNRVLGRIDYRGHLRPKRQWWSKKGIKPRNLEKKTKQENRKITNLNKASKMV